MILDETVRLCLLNDFYGSLLTKNQQDVLNMYLNYNVPLVEISQKFGITRQAVLDTIKKATKKLNYYETKLSMLKKYEEQVEIAQNYLDDSAVQKMIKVWD